ncbi:MAG: hypothetical protein ACR2KP_20175 [Egibacteraceae bacterium]
MAYVVLVIVLGLVAFLLYKAVQDARRQAEGGGASPTSPPRAAPRPPRERRTPPPKPARAPRPAKRPRRGHKPVVDSEALDEHVRKLRSAITDGLISLDEGVASIVRHTDGAMEDDDARRLLRDSG